MAIRNILAISGIALTLTACGGGTATINVTKKSSSSQAISSASSVISSQVSSTSSSISISSISSLSSSAPAVTSSTSSVSSASSTRPDAIADSFTTINSDVWEKRDGANGSPFGCTFMPSQVTTDANGLKLALEQGKCGELRSKNLLGYGRYETRLIAGSAEGTVSSLFTYTAHWDVAGRDWQEIDIEILPSFGNKLHTNVIHQPENGQFNSWEKTIDLAPYGVDALSGEIHAGFEWSASSIRWFIKNGQGQEVTLRTVTNVGTAARSADGIPNAMWPKDKTRLMVNHWHGDNSNDASAYFPKHYWNATATATYKFIGFTPE